MFLWHYICLRTADSWSHLLYGGISDSKSARKNHFFPSGSDSKEKWEAKVSVWGISASDKMSIADGDCERYADALLGRTSLIAAFIATICYIIYGFTINTWLTLLICISSIGLSFFNKKKKLRLYQNKEELNDRYGLWANYLWKALDNLEVIKVFLSKKRIETFVNMMFRMNRIFAVSLVLLIFSIWVMTVGGRLTLIVILGSAFSLVIGNYESKKINQKKKKMFEKRTKLVRMIRSIFEGTESYLTNWQYLSMVQRYEKENRVYIKEIEQVASQKARRGNWIRWVDGSVYLLLIILCYVLVKEESIRIVITMVSVYSTMKSYMNRLNDYVSYVIENMYVIEKYQEIQNDKKRKQEHTQQYIFEVKNLSYVVSGHKILESINFQMEDKKKIALIGKNGSGKSTFMKILLSVLSPTEGEVRRNQIKSYSYVPVKAQLFPVAIEENIMYGSAEKTRISMKKIMEAARLNIMGEERLKRVLPEGEEDLSGGEAQRVAIARAMAAQADVLIADEPTASLDIVTSEKVFENLIRTSPSVLFTTHNPKLLRYADEIYIMEKGRIVYSGTYEEVRKTEAYQKWKYEMNV